jgi:hypothetical protein
MSGGAREAEIDGHLRLLRLACGAIVAGASLLALVAYLLAAGGDLGRRGPAPAVAAALVRFMAPLAVVPLLLAPVVKRALFKRAEADGFGAGDAGIRSWLLAHRTATLVAVAIRESAAVAGFVLALVTGRPLWSYLSSALAVGAILLDWPRRGELEEA